MVCDKETCDVSPLVLPDPTWPERTIRNWSEGRGWRKNIDRVCAKGGSTELPVRSGLASASVVDSVLFDGVSYLGLAAWGCTEACVGWRNG